MKKQLQLFESFFNLELDFKNDYISYITTTHNKVTSVTHNNIVKRLKTKKFNINYCFHLLSINKFISLTSLLQNRNHIIKNLT